MRPFLLPLMSPDNAPGHPLHPDNDTPPPKGSAGCCDSPQTPPSLVETSRPPRGPGTTPRRQHMVETAPRPRRTQRKTSGSRCLPRNASRPRHAPLKTPQPSAPRSVVDTRAKDGLPQSPSAVERATMSPRAVERAITLPCARDGLLQSPCTVALRREPQPLLGWSLALSTHLGRPSARVERQGCRPVIAALGTAPCRHRALW